MSPSNYQVIARRYRPQRFQEVVGQELVVTTLKNALRLQRTAHAYLFSGGRGVGKTTLARLFAKAVNCPHRSQDCEPCNNCPSCREITSGQSLDVIEIDGASNRGIDDIRQISETAYYAPSKGSYKIYIIDEVHMLTKEAFNALLKTIEEPPERAKFLFATTEPHKVLPTILSRCQRFELKRIALPHLVAKLQEIVHDLSREVDLEALHLIASFSDGSLRDAESLLDQLLSFVEDKVAASHVRHTLGLMPQETFFALDEAFSHGNAAHAFSLVEELYIAGKDLSHFLTQLIEHVRLLSIARLSGKEALPLPSDQAARYLDASRHYLPSQCLYLLDYLLRTELQIQKSASERTALEGLLLHYIQSKNRIPPEVLIRRLSELEATWKNGEPVKERSTSLAPPIEESPAPLASSRKEKPAPLLEPVPFHPVAPPSPPVAIQEAPRSPAPPSPQEKKRHETLMRFAAVELEGKLKI